jgi:hypothetical protein
MSENVVMTQESVAAVEATTNKAEEPQPEQPQPQPQQVNLVSVPITNENVSLNVMVGFLNVAQKRGVFNVQESAKIWECIRMFQKPSGPQGPESM